MKATLTLDFGDRLKPEESREVIGEAMRRGVELEDVITEAIREWRAKRAASGLPPGQPMTAALTA